MALSQTMMNELCGRIKGGERIASFGYPDVIGEVSNIIGSRKIEYREDSAAICKRHGLPLHPIPDAESFFSALGCALTVFDIVKERGCETLCDLNEPIYGHEGYDFVIDVGTLEHCFNIGQAAQNMAGMVKAGGIILHENPFNWGNHGFYGFNPTWYVDFYEQNGFELLKCSMVRRDGSVVDAPQTKRFALKNDEEMLCFVVARRVEVVEFKWPKQTKYKHLLE